MSPNRLFLLMGSGEFEPWSEEAERFILSRVGTGDGTVLVAPTASVPDGEETFATWARRGLEHFIAMGVPARVLPLRDRSDAFDQALLSELDGAGMVFFSGGKPDHLARTLVGTPFAEALVAALDSGMALAGCSAGAMVCGEMVPTSMTGPLAEDVWVPALRLLPGVLIASHWDALEEERPDLRRFLLNAPSPDLTLLAIEERSAIAGGSEGWRTFGAGVHVRVSGNRTTYGPGERVPLELSSPLVPPSDGSESEPRGLA
jgi:cyanophycinase